jgi:hypothetical protein
MRLISCITGAAVILAVAARAHGESLDRYLMDAARRGDPIAVAQALDLGANANYCEAVPAMGGGETPLYLATHTKARDVVRLLLEHGANPLLRPPGGPPEAGPWGAAPVWLFPLAITKESDPEILDVLLSHVKTFPPDDDRIVDYVIRPAAARGDEKTLRRFEALGVRLSAVSPQGFTLVTAAAEVGRFDDAERWLGFLEDQYRKEPNRIVDLSGAVEYAAEHPAVDGRLAGFIEHLARAGLDFRRKDRWGDPPWKAAVRYRLPATARVLGCPPEELGKIVPRSDEELLFAAACRAEDYPLFVTLAAKIVGDGPEASATASRLLATLAAQKLHQPAIEAMQFLLAHEADANYELQLPKQLAVTPVQSAILAGNLDLASWLISHGAALNRLSSSGVSALEAAVWNGKESVLRWALEHGAPVQEGKTGRPLLRAALARPPEAEGEAVIAALVEAGSDPYLKSARDGKSAVDLLAERRDLLWLRRLDVKGAQESLLASYTPPPDSPFIGVWSNSRDGFGTITVYLGPDGLAVLGISIGAAGFFPWRAVSDKKVVVEATFDGKRTDVEVEWLPAEKAIRLAGIGIAGKSEPLRRTADRALTAEEYVVQVKAREAARKVEKPTDRYSWEKPPDYAPETKELSISGKQLTALDPRVAAMKDLTLLALRDNRLRSLPESLLGMNRLTTLGLAENWLGSLPPWFARLDSLAHLSLERNALREFPSELRPLKGLQSLDLSYNQIRSLPEWWGEFPALKHLDLSGNHITRIPDRCEGLASLESVRLERNDLTTLPECLLRLPKLRSLFLMDNPIPAAEQARLKKTNPKIDWIGLGMR